MKRCQVRRIVKTVIACGLAAVMGFINPAQSLAAGGGGKEYISEVRLSTAKTEKEAANWLKNNGYTIMTDKASTYRNFNQGTGENPVLLGYKTTKNPEKAITDMAVMDMDGGYSFSDYEEMLNIKKEEIKELVKALQAALTEYRANYNAGTPGAKKAYEMMNRIMEDDSGKLMGDYLLDETLSEDDLVKVIMQGNTIAMSSVYRGLALGCGESDTDNWLKRLSEIGPDDSLSTKYDSRAREIFAYMWDDLWEALASYEGSGLTLDASETDIKAWKSENGESAYSKWLQNAATYKQLASYSFGEGTLADFFMQDKDDLDDENGMAAFYPIVAAMTEGQRSVAKLAGMDYMIQVAVTSDQSLKEASEEAEKAADDMLEKEREEVKVPEVVSIYAGVDRSLFEGGIALTSEAMQKTAATGDNSWIQGNLSKGAEIALYTIAGTFTVFGVVCATFIYNFSHEFFLTPILDKFICFLDRFDLGFSRVGQYNFWFAACVCLAVVLIAVAVYIDLELLNYWYPEYTEIPRILVDERKDEANETFYVNYYAVKDQRGELADLNAWAGKKWNALYTTKDKAAGNPITTEMLCQTGKNTASEQYSPVHRFGESAAFNLNKHCYDDDVDGIYFFFVADAQANEYTGSSFGMGQMAMSAGLGALGGILLGTFFTTMAGKRKKKPMAV